MRLVEGRKVGSVGIEPKQMSYQRLRCHDLIILLLLAMAAVSVIAASLPTLHILD